MKTFTGQKKLVAGSAIQLLLNYCQENLFATGLAFLSPPVRRHCNNTKEYRHNTTKYNLKYELTKTKRQLVAQGDYSSVARQKFPRYFEGYLGVFAVFQHFCLFIPRFLAEPLTMFCRTLVGKHCYRRSTHEMNHASI
jgi:hypothetical protein